MALMLQHTVHLHNTNFVNVLLIRLFMLQQHLKLAINYFKMLFAGNLL